MVEDGLPEKMPIIHERSKSACPDGEEGVPEASKPPAMLARRQTPDARLLPPDGEAPLGGKSPSATGSAEVVSTSAATDQPLGPTPRSGACPAGASPSGRKTAVHPASHRPFRTLTSYWASSTFNNGKCYSPVGRYRRLGKFFVESKRWSGL